MSTGLECHFIETKGTWFYLLQNWDCPAHCWDWREYATAYGPFETQEKAHSHLRENHPNPGGYSIYELGDKDPDDVLKRALSEAEKPQTRNSIFSFNRYS